MAEHDRTDEVTDRLTKMEERLMLASGQAAFATAFATTILREMLKTGLLNSDVRMKMLENTARALKDHREKLEEYDRPGYDVALRALSPSLGKIGRHLYLH